MAEDLDFASKTEAPTPRRREEAHEKGQFALSAELTSGIVLFIAVVGLSILAHTLGGGLLAQTRLDLSATPPRDLTPEVVGPLLADVFRRGLMLIGIFMGVLFAATIVATVAQVGWHMNPSRLMFDTDRVSFFDFSRLLSWKKSVRGLVMLLKLSAVVAVGWWILRQRGVDIAQIGEGGLVGAVARSWDLVFKLALGLAGTLLFIGILDYAYQRWQFERSLHMSKQEIKEEHKREEGDPQIKARIRKMQREIAQRKMFQAVPKATVVITNPTHLAVALQYQAGQMGAPKVVAKGAGYIAKKIVDLARRNGVPVVERKPLAQALFKTVKIDREIPLALYVLVAELLAYVYRLKGGVPTQVSTQRPA